MLKKGFYIAKTIRLMNFLCKKYDVKMIIPDRDNNKFVVFLFDDSTELREYLAQYK